MASLESEIKNLLLDELRAKGYAPNQADVSIATSRLLELIARERLAAVEEVSKPVVVDSKGKPSDPSILKP